MTLTEYEVVRSRPTWFLVSVGHGIDDVEMIVSSTDRYQVVEKTQPPGPQIAEADAS